MISPTMKSCRIQILSLILAGLIAQSAHADVIPGRWEKVSALEMASSIMVELKNGDRIKGQFRGLSPSDLELLSPAGRAVIPKAAIQAITTQLRDGLGNGAAIGTAIGAAVGAAVPLIGTGGDGLALAVLIHSALAAGVGAAIGIVADGATKSEAIVVYKAPGTP